MIGWLKNLFEQKRSKKLAKNITDLSVHEAKILASMLATNYERSSARLVAIYVSSLSDELDPLAQQLAIDIGQDVSDILNQLENGAVFLREECDEPTVTHFVEKYEALGAKVTLKDV